MTEHHYSMNRMLSTASSWVDDAVNAVCSRGFTRERAVVEVAHEFSVTPGRIRKMLYGEAASISQQEYSQLKRRFLSLLMKEERRLHECKSAMRAKRARIATAHDPHDLAVDRAMAAETGRRGVRALGKMENPHPAKDPAQWSLLTAL